MPAKKIKTKRKNQRQVLNILRNLIIDGFYPPSYKLVEEDLVKEYGVSRSMLREIFVNLEIQGLIRKQPNKGAIVREINLKFLLEIMDIREVLEGLAVRLATKNTSPEDWSDLEEEVNKSWDEIVRNSEFERHLKLSRKFRSRIFDAARNEELSNLSDTLIARIMLVQRRTAILPGRIKQSAQEQRAVLRAIIEGNPSKAERLKRLNLRNAKACLNKYKNWIV